MKTHKTDIAEQSSLMTVQYDDPSGANEATNTLFDRLRALTLVLWFSLLIPSFAYADLDFMSTIEDRAKDLVDSLTGTIATTVITLVIVIFGFGTISGRINKVFAGGIIVGALMIALSANIAKWVLGST